MSNYPSIYQAAARARYPKATIKGDGPYAFVVSCFEACWVFLFSTELEAYAERIRMAGNCGHVRCQGDYCHTITRLKPASQATSSFRIAGDWEK